MTVTKEDFQYMVEATVSDLVRMLMEQTGASMHEAFDKVYGSETYRALNDPQSTYYYQSPGYVYEQLQSELKYQPLKTVNNMEKYVCDVCGYVYDPAVGDPDNGIAPGTKFEDLPADWVCPLCSVDKTHFEKN